MNAREGMADIIVSRHKQLREAAAELQITDDLGMHASAKCREALDDACGLIQNHMSQCRIATSVASMATTTALREAVLAAREDKMPANPVTLLDAILGAVKYAILTSIANEDGTIDDLPEH